MNLGKMNWLNLLDYTIQPSDLDLFQTYMSSGALRGASRGIGIVSGGEITVVSGLTLQVAAGVGIMPDGTLVAWPNLQTTLATANPTLPRYDRIELAYVATNNTNVLDVNSISRVLDIINLVSINVVQGTPNASPAFPTQTSANLSLGFINVTAAMTLITTPSIMSVVDSGFQTSPIVFGTNTAFIRYNKTATALQFSTDGVHWQAFGSGGGGGGGANWQGVGGVAPEDTYEFDEKALKFAQGDTQSVCLFIRVADSYLPGSPIKMKLAHYGESGANNFKFQTTTYLIRQGLDPVNSTVNSYQSTNGDVLETLAFEYQGVTYDLSSSSGLINGIAPSPSDLIKVVLQRVTPTGTEDTADVRMIPSSTEVTFS
jgi:hypothetical protein